MVYHCADLWGADEYPGSAEYRSNKAEQYMDNQFFRAVTGFLACILIWAAAEHDKSFLMLTKVHPRYLLLGGVIGAAITFTVIKSVSALGPAQSAMLIVASQVVVSYLIEVFGWFGTEKTGFQWIRLVGVILFVAGLVIFKWKS